MEKKILRFKGNGSDDAVPVFIKHTEAILDEIDKIEEVEMEDVEEEPVLDIDACDWKDPLAVVEYIDDIYSFYKDIELQREHKNP